MKSSLSAPGKPFGAQDHGNFTDSLDFSAGRTGYTKSCSAQKPSVPPSMLCIGLMPRKPSLHARRNLRLMYIPYLLGPSEY
jgi:hypothetical protein